MKKILLGLLALSSISLAANVDLRVAPADNTNLFQAGGTGKIDVKATFVTPDTTIRYVIFANTAESLQGAEDVLVLSDFVMEATAGAVSPNAGFSDTNPTLYVRRLSSTNTLESLQDTDRMTVRFRSIRAEGQYTSLITDTTSFPADNEGMLPTALLSADNLKKLASATGLTLHSGGLWLDDGSGKAIGLKSIKFHMPSNGTVEIKTGKNTTSRWGYVTDSNVITDQDIINKWNNFFATEKEFSTHIEVILN